MRGSIRVTTGPEPRSTARRASPKSVMPSCDRHYMPALSAMRFIPAVAALVARAGRLKPRQIVVAAMRKLSVLSFGVLKTGKRFDPAIAMPA
jgi:hypothetical protein